MYPNSHAAELSPSYTYDESLHPSTAITPRNENRTNLLDLPLELIDAIINHLEAQTELYAPKGHPLASLAYTSKTFHSLMSRHAYLKMSICHMDRHQIERWSECMTSSPDLATRVRWLYVGHPTFADYVQFQISDPAERHDRVANSMWNPRWMHSNKIWHSFTHAMRALLNLKE
jgi:hypothetical protein